MFDHKINEFCFHVVLVGLSSCRYFIYMISKGRTQTYDENIVSISMVSLKEGKSKSGKWEFSFFCLLSLHLCRHTSCFRDVFSPALSPPQSTSVSCLCVAGIPGGSETHACKGRITNIDSSLKRRRNHSPHVSLWIHWAQRRIQDQWAKVLLWSTKKRQLAGIVGSFKYVGLSWFYFFLKETYFD